MVERTDELRQDIEARRRNISRTVDQIGNRVSPGRVMARGSYRMRRRLVDLRDEVMGNDEPEYPWERGEQRGQTMTETKERMSDRVDDMADTAREKVSEAGETIRAMPHQLRSQTRGNPIAAGLIAFGGGLLLGSVFGETSAEKRALRQAQPMLDEVAQEARDVGHEIAEEMSGAARQSVEKVKDEVRDSGERLRDDASESARNLSDEARRQT